MIIYNFYKPFAAVSYDTTTFADLCEYMKEEDVELVRVDPEQPLSKDYQYINLVTQDFELRKQINQQLNEHTRFSYIHPSTVVGKNTSIGQGVFVYPMCAIYSNSTIDNDVLIHGHGFVAHGVRIKQGTIFAPRVSVSGSTTVGEYCFVGIGATLIDKVKVCNRAYIGAGAVVVDDIILAGTYIGVPAKQL